MYLKGVGALQPPHCVLNFGQASKSSGTGSHQCQGEREATAMTFTQPSPGLCLSLQRDEELQSLGNSPLSHPSCSWGHLLGYQLVEIRVSPLNLGPHSELP